MMTDRNRAPETGLPSPADDNERADEIKSGVPDPEMKTRVDKLVFVLARLLCRQIAREEFERRVSQIDTANDNDPAARTGSGPGRPG